MIRRLLVSVLGLTAVALAVVAFRPAPAASTRSTYYRVKVGLTYKGEPVDIDFVAGCGVHTGRDLSGGSTREVASMTDRVRGVRMPEGHAVVINTFPHYEGSAFNPCDGDTTAGGKVPKDWLPFIVWFERDDALAQGVGYMTQDAYETGSARFGFRSAAIERATKQEFDAFRKAGPANLLPPHQADWMSEPTDPVYHRVEEVPESVRRDPPSGWRHTEGRVCHGIVRTRLTEPQRAILRAAWPQDRPDYWSDSDLPRHVASQINRSHPELYFGGILLTRYGAARAGDPASGVFPTAWNGALDRLSPSTPPISEMNALIGDGTSRRGQVFCDAFNGAIQSAVRTKIGQPGCVALIDGVQVTMIYPNGCSDMEIAPIFYRDEQIISTIHSFIN